MDTVEVSTVVYISPEAAHEFLVDFPGYARYSEYLERVDQYGDGGPGTEYDLHFAWWKLSYTARSRVVAVEPSERVDWAVIEDIDARGRWLIEELPAEEVPPDREHATRVRLQVQFLPDSADESAIDLPGFVSLGWVIEKVKPLIQEEAERVVRRIVADLEGEQREVDLEIHTTPDSV
ncbi:MAG: SRPBCC family protein [Haloglomus sp.]